MSVERSTFKVWSFECLKCGAKRKVLQWDYEAAPECCEQQMAHELGPGHAHAVIGDEIDWTIRHGPVAADGRPVRYRSRSEWKRACEAKGWTPMGDTPKTYEERHRWT